MNDYDTRPGIAIPPVLGLLALFIFILLAVATVFSAVAALVGGLVLLLAARRGYPGASVTYGSAYKAALLALLTFIVVFFGLTYALAASLPRDWTDGLLLLVKPFDPSIRLPAETDLVRAMLVATSVLVISIAAHALVVVRRLKGAFLGFEGFLAAFAVSIPTILAGSGSAVALGFLVVRRLQAQTVAPGDLLPALLITITATFLYAAVAGLVTALLTKYIARLTADSDVRYASAYGTSVLALIVYLLTTALVLFLGPGFDPTSMAARSLSHAPLDVWMRTALSLDAGDLMRTIAVAQIPGLLISGAIVGARLGPGFKGVAGYSKAVAVTAFALGATVAGTLWAVVHAQ